jgi:hypothetical protein
MQLVSTVTVGAGGAASISFTGIPQSATDLMVLLSERNTNSGTVLGFLTFNSNFGSVYSDTTLLGSGSSASPSAASSVGAITYQVINESGTTANTFSNTSFYIPNYTAAANKSISIDGVSENNATAAEQTIQASRFASTSAITSLLLSLSAGNFAQHTTASLYTITKA